MQLVVTIDQKISLPKNYKNYKKLYYLFSTVDSKENMWVMGGQADDNSKRNIRKLLKAESFQYSPNKIARRWKRGKNLPQDYRAVVLELFFNIFYKILFLTGLIIKLHIFDGFY